MSVVPMVPAIGRDRAAMGVLLSEAAIMTCTSPDACLSSRGVIAYSNSEDGIAGEVKGLASGVRSLRPNPVPPVVIIQSNCPIPAHFLTIAWIASMSSGTIAVSVIVHSAPSSTSRATGPDLSLDASLETVSLTIDLRQALERKWVR